MKTLLKNALIINEGTQFNGHIVIQNDHIESILTSLPPDLSNSKYQIIDATGKIVLPGVIDDQVHFRDPGLTHKGDLYSESKAAVAGGVTSFMEMPNTNPQTITQAHLAEKFDMASQKSMANFSFYMGATNDNLKEIVKTDAKHVCGIKVFMGASTGNMLVDNQKSLEGIFADAPCLIATHCEDEKTIKQNLEVFKSRYGENILASHHPFIRSEESCYVSSSKAVELATKFGSQLHILHLSTARELSLLSYGAVDDKKITGEVCVHHLWFDDRDYIKLGNRIKWNPAIKTQRDKEQLLNALLTHKIDVVATDHAPHLLEEKLNSYTQSASGGPLVQHSLLVMLELFHQGKIKLEEVVEKMCHAPAKLFKIEKRGFIKPGYYADLVLVDLNRPNTVTKETLLYKCQWSPFEGMTFQSTVTHTFVNGKLIYDQGLFHEEFRGTPLTFLR